MSLHQYQERFWATVNNTLVRDFLSDEKPLQVATFAFMLSSGGQDIGRVRNIISKNMNSGHARLEEDLQKGVQDISQAPLGVRVMSTAISRSLKNDRSNGVQIKDQLR